MQRALSTCALAAAFHQSHSAPGHSTHGRKQPPRKHHLHPHRTNNANPPPPQVARWFEDTLAEAKAGDTKQQALLGQMYEEGYGTKRDAAAAARWADKARMRGYRQKGVSRGGGVWVGGWAGGCGRAAGRGWIDCVEPGG
jgi:TPR repeat protein